MADPVTINRSLAQPTLGSDVGAWNVPLNGNFGLLDTIVGGVTTISTTGGNTTLNAAQLQGGTISVTGALASNAGLIFPAVQGWWSIENLTTGASVLFVSAGAGTEIICLPPGEITDIQINGNNARFRNLGRIGSYWDYAGAAVPAWVTQCSKPPYLNCDGSAYNTTTYPALAAILATSVLPDIRGTTRYTLNQGTNRVTAGGSGIDGNTRFTIGGDQLMQGHTHGVIGATGSENANHTHNLNGGVPFSVGQGSVGNGNASPGASGPPVTISSVTGIESAVHQHAINFSSQTAGSGIFQNMPPVTISGICMIRAG